MLVIKFVNDQTGTKKKGNYRYKVLVTEMSESETKVVKIAEGEIKNHSRDTGWEGLVKKFSNQLEEEKYSKLAMLCEDLKNE